MAIERKAVMGGLEHFAEGEKLLRDAARGGISRSDAAAQAEATMALAHFAAAIGCVLTDLVKAVRSS